MNEFISASPEETRNHANAFAKTLKPGDIVALIGELGTGKTEFTRGLCDYFECGSRVTSPSFAIVNTYSGRFGDNHAEIDLYHFDFYRIKSIDELFGIGIEEYLYDDGICILEWADRFPELLPRHTQTVSFERLSENERKIAVSKKSELAS